MSPLQLTTNKYLKTKIYIYNDVTHNDASTYHHSLGTQPEPSSTNNCKKKNTITLPDHDESKPRSYIMLDSRAYEHYTKESLHNSSLAQVNALHSIPPIPKKRRTFADKITVIHAFTYSHKYPA